MLPAASVRQMPSTVESSSARWSALVDCSSSASDEMRREEKPAATPTPTSATSRMTNATGRRDPRQLGGGEVERGRGDARRRAAGGAELGRQERDPRNEPDRPDRSGPPVASIAPNVRRSPASRCRARACRSSARTVSRTQREVSSALDEVDVGGRAHLAVSFAVGFCSPPSPNAIQKKTPKAAKSAEQDRHVEEAEDEPGVRDPQLLRADDVVVRRVPEIRRGAVVALHRPAGRAVAADDPVDDDVAGADLSLRHAVGDDLADVVARPVLDEHEVAGVEARQHARAAHHHPVGAAAEALRQAEPEAAPRRGRRARRASRARAASAAASATAGAAGGSGGIVPTLLLIAEGHRGAVGGRAVLGGADRRRSRCRSCRELPAPEACRP